MLPLLGFSEKTSFGMEALGGKNGDDEDDGDE